MTFCRLRDSVIVILNGLSWILCISISAFDTQFVVESVYIIHISHDFHSKKWNMRTFPWTLASLRQQWALCDWTFSICIRILKLQWISIANKSEILRLLILHHRRLGQIKSCLQGDSISASVCLSYFVSNTFRFDLVRAFDYSISFIAFSFVALVGYCPWSRCTHFEIVIIIRDKFTIFVSLNHTLHWAINFITVDKRVTPISSRFIPILTKVIIFDSQWSNFCLLI